MAEEEDEDSGTPRPFWSGTIAFGLVSLPVSLYPANRGRAISLKMVDADGTPLAREFFCEKEDKALAREDIVRGFKVDEHKYIVVDDDELQALAPEKSREIDLRRFVKLEDINPMYFERAYFLVPEQGADKAYRLLAKSMDDEGRAGIATFVMRGKEYLCAIVSERGILRAETLRFADELRSPAEVGLPERHKPKKTNLTHMQAALRKLATSRFNRKELADEHVASITKLVKKKLASGKDVIKVPEEVAEELAAEDNVVDLMQVLRARLQGKPAPPSATPRPHSHRGHHSAHAKRTKSRSHASSAKTADGGLTKLSKGELYERAQAQDIAGRASMSKEQLIRALHSK
jgi:DNA end-binding protein Ku